MMAQKTQSGRENPVIPQEMPLRNTVPAELP